MSLNLVEIRWTVLPLTCVSFETCKKGIDSNPDIHPWQNMFQIFCSGDIWIGFRDCCSCCLKLMFIGFVRFISRNSMVFVKNKGKNEAGHVS